MISSFSTPNKQYELYTEKYICNKFGLAEFFAKNMDDTLLLKGASVLDVGCGAGPLGIFLADQFECIVRGIDLNPHACFCCERNISKYMLENKFEVFHRDFSKMILENGEPIKYDCIVANPPIDSRVKKTMITKYRGSDYENLDDESFAYLTNSWHTEDGRDLVDYIFLYALQHLNDNGSVVMVVCLMDCESIDYVIKKGNKYSFEVHRIINGEILPESVGAETITNQPIKTFLIQFSRR